MKTFDLAVFTAVAGASLAACVLSGCSEGDGVRPASAGGDDAGPSDAIDAGLEDAPASDARPPFDASAPEIGCAVTPCMTRLVSGPTHYCAVATDGVIRCWGNPSALGELAGQNPNGDPGATPVVIAGITDAVDIGGSSLRTCVARATGDVDCFGRDTPKPTRVAGVSGARRLAIGEERSCAIVSGDVLSCWGDSRETGEGAGPVALGGAGAVDVATSAPAAFAIVTGGALFSWGADPFMLGRETPLDVDWTPGRVEGLPPALRIAVSDRHACAITTDGRLYCWGHGDDGALGLGSIRSVPEPMEVFFPGPAWPAQIAVAQTHSCARMTDGSLTCWARRNASGELGYGDVAGVFIPTKVTLAKSVAAVAVGTGSTCALATDGSVWCWGDNVYGQLGLGRRDAQRHWVPTQVVFP